MTQQTAKSGMHRSAKTEAWLVVVGSTIALIVGNGPILLFTFGVFLKPITDQTGWQRGTMSLGVAVGLTIAGLATLRHYGVIYGYVFAIFTVGSGVGPYLMGLSFDATHSYITALGVFCAMLIASSVLISRMGAYRFPAGVMKVAV